VPEVSEEFISSENEDMAVDDEEIEVVLDATKKPAAATKKRPGKATKKRKKFTPPAELSEQAPADLPESLNPDNHVQLVNFFASFGLLAKTKKKFSIVTAEGRRHMNKLPAKSLTRLVASLIVHFAYYASSIHSGPLPRCKLCNCEALWHPRRRAKTIGLIESLDQKHTFLQQGESAASFAETFKFGQTHQNYRNRFRMPKGKPTHWWQDGHQFSGNACYGLHVEFKPFFERLGVPLGDHAYQAESKKESQDTDMSVYDV
jgi:hypothetical protein